MKPGSPEKYDYEYQRMAMQIFSQLLTQKQVKETLKPPIKEPRKILLYYMKHLINEVFPEAEVIRVVLDNLNTHKESSFHETFKEKEAKRLLSKIKFHYTPKTCQLAQCCRNRD